MNAVVRLVLTYAFGTRILSLFSVAGFTVLIAAAVLLAFLPSIRMAAHASLSSVRCWCSWAAR